MKEEQAAKTPSTCRFCAGFGTVYLDENTEAVCTGCYPTPTSALPDMPEGTMREEHGPYLCIAPACGSSCEHCAYAISPATTRLNAVRYSLLQRMDPRFGMPADWLNFKTLDEAVDSELATLARATGEPKP